MQHVKGYVYNKDMIYYSTWFCVALFIMIGGFNTMSSWTRRGNIILKKRLLRIFLPYLLATIIYTIYAEHYLNATVVLSHLLHFDATGPLYYVAVYMQLALITPVLVGILNWCCGKYERFKYIIVWAGILVVCYVTVHSTNLFDIIIGGGNLFAGPWLMFWFMGMFVRKIDLCFEQSRRKIVIFICNSFLLLIWQCIFVFEGINLKLKPIFGGAQVMMTWANSVQVLLIFFWIRALVGLLEVNAEWICKWLLRPIEFLGKHTLYVFLYHMLFLNIYKNYLEIQGSLNRWLCLLFIIYGPIVLEYIVIGIKKWFKNVMYGIQVDEVVL